MCKCNSIKSPIQFMVGDSNPLTPIDGGTQYVNPDIKYDKYLLIRNGVGVLFEGVHYSRIPTGGIQLLAGDQFSNGEFFTIIFYE